jgi:hypothetical protein
MSRLPILVQTPTPNIAITISTLQTPPLPNEQVSSTLLLLVPAVFFFGGRGSEERD